jgi:hypothetical protein
LARINEGGVLDGADVLPEFRLPLKQVFDRADKLGPARRKNVKRGGGTRRRANKNASTRRNGNGRR